MSPSSRLSGTFKHFLAILLNFCFETMEKQEPVTPAGRLFLQEEMNAVINCVIGLKHPIDEYTIKTEMKNSIMLQHARFRSILVKDKEGREYWETITDLNIDQHIFLVKDIEKIYGQRDDCKNDDTMLVNSYLADLSVSTPLDIHKPLWELHLLKEQKCAILRVHQTTPKRTSLMLKEIKKSLTVLSMAFLTDFISSILNLAVAAFLGQSSTPDPPLNFVSASFTNKLQEGLRITGLGMVNLRKQPGLQDMSELVKNKPLSSWWGNKFGFILLPIYHHKNVDNDPLQYVRRAKAMLDKKKLSLEAHFSYTFGNLVMSLLGPKAAMLLNYRVVCNTSFTISNVVGPKEEIMFGGNPVTSFRVTSTSLPHALTMHMLSYAGNAELQILVAKDIIPDPQFLAKCFEDALLEMKDISFWQEDKTTSGMSPPSKLTALLDIPP
ncbi:uncharacterized protein LOC113349747 [Papaver somniferum]|uniref:uncharacterized protein LOC113349747 n=1 Tax=Papaver somniferum TaxID=3469 RepID=UPI000E6F8853|nr:uncharacterized protein LOC113349747 [Papaver somniferum]